MSNDYLYMIQELTIDGNPIEERYAVLLRYICMYANYKTNKKFVSLSSKVGSVEELIDKINTQQISSLNVMPVNHSSELCLENSDIYIYKDIVMFPQGPGGNDYETNAILLQNFCIFLAANSYMNCSLTNFNLTTTLPSGCSKYKFLFIKREGAVYRVFYKTDIALSNLRKAMDSFKIKAPLF